MMIFKTGRDEQTSCSGSVSGEYRLEIWCDHCFLPSPGKESLVSLGMGLLMLLETSLMFVMEVVEVSCSGVRKRVRVTNTSRV